MNKLFAYVVTAVFLVGGVAFVAQCGGPVCGDGKKEGSELCDNGALNGTQGNSCSAMCMPVSVLRAQVQVSWQRLKDEVPGYGGSSCNDLGAAKTHIVVSGPTPRDTTVDCTTGSIMITDAAPGDYSAKVTLLDASMQPLTKDVQTMTGNVQVPGMLALMVNFHQEDFLKQDYRGTLYFSPHWGAMGTSCSAATPAVEMESVTLTKDNTPVSGMTQTQTNMPLHNLNGTPSACFYMSSGMSFEKVPDLLWGKYKLAIVGRIAGGTIGYCKVFDVFVGPGIATQTYPLVVPAWDADGGACP